jgi:hypothetical protein
MDSSSSVTPGSEPAETVQQKSKLRKPRKRSVGEIAFSLFGVAARIGLVYVVVASILLLLVLIHFPYHVDEAAPQKTQKTHQNYYSDVYGGEKSPTPDAKMTEAETKYVRVAREAIERDRIGPKVAAFVAQYGLAENKRVLDVGAGTGYLQDHVKDYVGLDISPTARR